ncbi:MAG: ABC transporter substrate-binding protein [Nitrospinaceae bacterium]|nr:ABC transporter substrate-binding protein [Nitrospinaceae bacterium]NIR56055.1 ABC transporter substrate-binding protein [Nitrospinaceae bacterium]NIS86500.1 ABC transporter substrate-binding protein [Nitrospinaceae bacterium]NIT83335.1 ABC transporter substrate-binding protein [Nitrospinaceae bacterium]NIU45544.1 ABC transporter substrate-binding protein [Nitrospinaceae bacterium]
MSKTIFKSHGFVIGIAALLFLGAGENVQASSVTESLKATIDQLIGVVTDPKYKDDRATRRTKMKGIIYPKFDFYEMGKRSLGRKSWTARTSEEKKAFVDIFGKLLENSYASKLESYSDEKIVYVDEILKGKFAMVKTEVVRKNDTIKIDYKLIRTKKEWLVFDIVIEGVSMIKNYRSQFAKIIHKNSFGGLMDKLNKKVQKLESKIEGEDSDKI